MIGGADDPRTAARHEIAGAVFVFLTLLVASSMALLVLGVPADPESTSAVRDGMLAQLFGSLVALGVARVWRSRAGWRGDGRVLFPLMTYAGFVFLWLPVAIGATTLWAVLDLPVEPQHHLAFFTQDPTAGDFVLVALTVCVVGPLIEEVVFRGHLQTGLTTLVGPRAAILLSAALFGLVHTTSGTVLFLPITFLGVFFGWLRARCGGLLAPVLAHVAHNSLTVAVVVAVPSILQGS